MRALPLLATVLLLLSGCSGAPDAPTQSEEDIDFGDVQATDTTGVIRGLVVDTAIRPLVGAQVTLPSTPANRTATTGADGQFAFDGLEPGTYFLQVSLANYTTIQAQAEVVAGESEPRITKVVLERLAGTQPFVDAYHYTGYLTFGAAIGLTSIGTTIYGPLAEQFNDKSIWYLTFTQLPMWAQGELVWEQTQPAGGDFIWEMTDTSNTHHGHRETRESPALAYWNTTVLEENRNTTLDPERGIAYRFFGGPHPALAPGAGILPPREQCPPVPVLGYNPCSFGFGVTVQQQAEAYIHNFFNFAPPEGWRYTVDGDPAVPPPA